MKRKLYSVINHLTIIILIFLAEIKLFSLINPKERIVIIASFYALDVCLFYFVRYFCLPYIELKQRWFYWVLGIPIILIILLTASYLASIIITLTLEGKPFPLPTIEFFIYTLLPASLILIIASLSFYNYWSRKRAIELVRSQYLNKIALYNPHLIFNMANVLYSDIAKLDDELGEKTFLLVDCLRFSLKQQNETGMISLQDELDYLERFIAMHQYINHNALYIRQRIDLMTDCAKIFIPPLVIVTLVDNMVKHGDLLDADAPGLITITCTKKQLDVHLFNKKSVNPYSGTGIGISNVSFRLNQAFGRKSKLSVNPNGNNFEINLSIKL